MSASDLRNKRCIAAIRQTLDFLRRDESSAKDVAMLSRRFLSARSMLESCADSSGREILSDAEADLLSMIPGLTRYARRTQLGPHPMLSSKEAAGSYLKTLFHGLSIEHFYLLCMDTSGRLIECCLLQKGTVDQTAFYINNLLQSVISTDAQAVVLCHNHPGGTLRPSPADIDCTLNALKALYPLRVMLLDHIIIAGQQAVSMREFGFIKPHLWHRQNPESKLLQSWLET